MQIQLHLKSLIPSLSLEKRVEDRIADALWEEEKIVFEIQCSSMSLDEAKSRTDDYQKKGYAVVWLLHDRRFNKKSLSPMEEFIRREGIAYFTDGRNFYDQFDVCTGSRRVFRGAKLIADLTKPRKIERLSFQGDFIHWSESHDVSHLRKIVRRYRKRRWGMIFKFLVYRALEGCTL